MTRLRVAAAVLGTVAVVYGLVGLVVAEGSLTNRRGQEIGWSQIELALGSFNRFGALLTIGLGVLALVGAWRGASALLACAAAGFALMAVQVLVQWGRGANVLGSGGRNLSMWAGLSIGLAALVWGMRAAASTSRS